ncbi:MULTISPECIES: 4-Cys prefix domain-containing protein [Planktothricoides]
MQGQARGHCPYYCLNSQKPQNPVTAKYCQGCGLKLLPH